MATTDGDPEAALDELIDRGVVTEATDGTLATTSDFESTQAIYYDTYVALGDDDLVATVTDVFDVDRETAADRIEDEDLTREGIVSYLSLQSELDPTPDELTLALMAEIVTQLQPSSPVPASVQEVDEDDLEAFLSANPDAVVTVWKRFCDPCDEMKAEFDAILDRLPADVAVAGLEGEDCPEFVNEYDVSAAPALVVFRDGEHVRTETGRQTPADVDSLVDETVA
ncbi:thioredoxin family protein [Halobacteriales archaeon Cl-PHB]